MQIIDFHAHAFPDKIAGKVDSLLSDFYMISPYGNGTLAQLLAQEESAGVSAVVVSATATAPRQVQNLNNWVAAAQQADKRIVAFGSLHPDYPDIEQEVDRMLALGIRGVKLHPDFQQADLLCPGMRRIFAAISGRLPVLIHVGDKRTAYSAPYKAAQIIDDYPQLTVIAAHMGGYNVWDEAEKWIIGKNCYIDTSSTFWALPKERIKQLILHHGTDKVLFGSDYPLASAQEELDNIASLGLLPQQQQDILYNNAAKLLKI